MGEKKLMCVIVIDKDCQDYYWVDPIGGAHSPPIGWSPNGEWCGECNRITCEGCKVAENERK